MNNKYESKISKRYAKSLLNTVLESNLNLNDIVSNLDNAKAILLNSNDLYEAVMNPVISAEDKKNVIEAVFEKDCIVPVRNFLKILVEKNRFNFIYSIIDEFKKLLNKINNTVEIGVTSAIELQQDTKEEIQEKLRQKLNKNISIDYKTDSSIIAGLVYRIEDDILDVSFKRKIEDLKKELL